MSQPEIEYTIESAEETLTVSYRTNRRQDAEMDVTPMIDITFLLLIFFLVSSRMTDEAFVQLPPARHGTAVSHDTSVVVTLAKGTGQDAVIFKGEGTFEDTRIKSRSLEDQQKELESYIEKGLTVEGKLQVLIKAEVGVRHRDVARVAMAASEATATMMYVAVLEER